MNPEDLVLFLRHSLDDHKLSKSEKIALADWLAKNVTTDQARGLVRHVAFMTAKATVADPASEKLIDWLEDVMKVLVPNITEQGADAPRSPVGEDLAFFAPGERCLQQIIHRFGQCRRTADVCVFTITDDRITRSILDANRRGVKLRIISDNDKCLDPGSDIQKLRDAGIAVKLDDMRDRRDPHLTGHMHHKFAIFDCVRLINGSYNWTRGAADCNYENVVDTADAKLIAAFAAEFERLWNAF